MYNRSNDHSSRYSASNYKPTDDQQKKINVQKRLESLTNDEIKIKNRVSLLETEQKRILKKVEETRVRAVKINSIKAANEQSYIDRI